MAIVAEKRLVPAGLLGLDYMLIGAFAALVGYSERAIRRKIESGVWTEGREYIRGRDRHIYIKLSGFCAWVQGKS